MPGKEEWRLLLIPGALVLCAWLTERKELTRDLWAYTEKLPEGVAGIRRTLEVMAWLVRRDSADPFVRDFAAGLVSHIRGHDFNGEIGALFEWVRDGITYRRDPVRQERVQDTRRTIWFGCGDCDDKVVALASLLGALGHRSRFVVLGYSSRGFSHVFLEVLTRRGWLPLDPTPEGARVGWQGRGAMRAVFPIFE